MPSLNVLIKPASGQCNLRCSYCFYRFQKGIQMVHNNSFMSLEMLETLIRKAFNYAEDSCIFAFQGGEPTLIGLEFFKKYVELKTKLNDKNIKVFSTIQTNGTLINDKWVQFFKQNNFLVGLSLDGPKEIHNINRKDAKQKGTYKRVLYTINLFEKYNVEYNILSVISKNLARHIIKGYKFFQKMHFKHLQFIPCLDPLGEKLGGQPYSLKNEEFLYFLKTLFDLWYEDYLKGNYVSINLFENYLSLYLGYIPGSCGTLGVCRCQFVVEADGSVYPCDFYVTGNWYMGNLKERSFKELHTSSVARLFEESSMHIDHKCTQCKWFFICRGGCRRNREPFNDGKPILNYYCPSFEKFFDYSFPRLEQVAISIRKRTALIS